MRKTCANKRPLTMRGRKASMKWGSDDLGRAQRKHLNDRIDTLRSERFRDPDRDKKPADVAAAYRIVAAWEAKTDKATTARNRKIWAACERADQEVLFSKNAESALAAVARLENEARQKGWLKA